MIQIEQDMVSALIAADDFQRGNTKVTHTGGVYLHGNHIASVDPTGPSVRATMAGFPTRTTRSRINAVLEGLGYQARVRQHKGGQQICFAGFSLSLDPDHVVRVTRGGVRVYPDRASAFAHDNNYSLQVAI